MVRWLRSFRRHRRSAHTVLKWLGASEAPRLRVTIAIGLFVFLLSFAVRSLEAVDLAPLMGGRRQPMLGMSREYDRDALSTAARRGLLVPEGWPASDTSLLTHAPGYPLFLSVIYRAGTHNWFYVQLVQNLINSLSPVIAFWIAYQLLSFRVGAFSGVIAALSHHFSYYSNIVLPDSVCALPILLALLVLTQHRRRLAVSIWPYALSGTLIGISIWLRPNALLMGPFIAALILMSFPTVRRNAWLVLPLAVMPTILVVPITVRNYMVFHQFVLISENKGIVLWEGIGNADNGGRFHAPKNDDEVVHLEAEIYHNREYGKSWATPDGIMRDRDRTRRCLGIIVRHPIWFTGAMLGRMRRMVAYVADAPLVFKRPPSLAPETEVDQLNLRPEELSTGENKGVPRESIMQRCLAPGIMVSPARPIVRALQRLTKETNEIFMLLGALVVLLLAPRRAIIILAVPLYYLLVQSGVHTEFRYTLPMHYFLFILAAVTWTLLLSGGIRAVRSGIKRLRA